MNRKQKTVGIASTFDDIRADYDMSRENRFIRRRTGLAPQGNSADWHYRNEDAYYRDIEKARDMDRNDSIIGQTLDRAVDNIVQDGFTLDPKTGSRELDDILYEKWNDWANNRDDCDIQGEFCWHDFERYAMRSMLLDGDIVFLGLGDDLQGNGGKLQAIEAHSIRTSTRVDDTVLGVTKDKYGRRLKYWIIQDPIEPHDTRESATPVDVRDENNLRTLFHIYRPDRTTQTRGVTALAPIFAVAGMRDDIQFAKLVQQQVASCFAVFRKRQYIPNDPHSDTPSYGMSETESTETGTRYIENIAPGMEIVGAPGEELQGFSPDIPGQGYEFQFKEMLTTIGVNLGLPLCLVLMDGSETNFSGWRGAVDEARKGFRSNQRNLIQRLHTPVYQWKLSHWIEEDERLQALLAEDPKIRLAAHKWNAPTWQYIDPVGDAQGDMLRTQNALTSRRRLHAERGQDWEEVAEEIVEDAAFMVRKAKEAATKINSEFSDGQPVQWRELASMPMPNGIQMTMQDPEAVTLQERDTQADEDGSGPKQPSGDGEPRKLTIMEALQKIYLSVGTVITADEARRILELEYGISLPAGFDLDGAMKQNA